MHRKIDWVEMYTVPRSTEKIRKFLMVRWRVDVGLDEFRSGSGDLKQE